MNLMNSGMKYNGFITLVRKFVKSKDIHYQREKEREIERGVREEEENRQV
jgi:phosphoribosylaminoimidazole (AIR) synthetase